MMKWLCLFLLWMGFVGASSFEQMPVMERGRVHPAEAYAQQWFSSLSHRNEEGALKKLWKLHFMGHEALQAAEIFWVQDKEIKEALRLEKRNRFSFQELYERIYEQEVTNVALMELLLSHHYRNHLSQKNKRELSQLTAGLWITAKGESLVVSAAPEHSPWHFLKPKMAIREKKVKPQVAETALGLVSAVASFASLSVEMPLETAYAEAVKDGMHVMPSKELFLWVEGQYPLQERLKRAGQTFCCLPGKNGWISLKALKCKVYDSEKESLVLASNFTLYDDASFARIRERYFAVEKAFLGDGNVAASTEELASELINAYRGIEGKVWQKAHLKQLTYPTLWQLRVENWLSRGNLVVVLMLLYLSALLLTRTRFGVVALCAAFALHTGLLALRCYVLQRPPVSNMFETVVYVPWITTAVALGLWLQWRQRALVVVAGVTNVGLLGLLYLSGLNASFDNVQPVLDSQYWLIVHVLMVVGSYGIFIFCGVLGHIALLKPSQGLTKTLARSMYCGTGFLIVGTILGGVWAAQSWGRFWDWDPKESWAFISCCTYLIMIHAYVFGLLGQRGLAVGSILGMQVIGFTWYGVNYILGTGLHSYGFGSGGVMWYLLFLVIEVLFLLFLHFNRSRARFSALSHRKDHF